MNEISFRFIVSWQARMLQFIRKNVEYCKNMPSIAEPAFNEFQ